METGTSTAMYILVGIVIFSIFLLLIRVFLLEAGWSLKCITDYIQVGRNVCNLPDELPLPK